jgi:hypothetical protein
MPVDTESRRTARFSHVFARLLELHNYVWDPETEPFHSVSVLGHILYMVLMLPSPTTTGTSSDGRSL